MEEAALRFFVPKAQRILAGDEITGTSRKISPAPAGATD
jgi:hypothetical protein